ncbi:Imm15 family immunity protein [Leminorella grimontii]|uniref:Imm15 family immunity protein n=1 Tax=Leminorella grimontii TaxID=82981 RepID=UPI00208803A5|nr:Imm15 family immunity protein [Leminorella grimontii]GKX59044.1 hypothetical protein SOASR031_13590 [Leminorella grimontii]
MNKFDKEIQRLIKKEGLDDPSIFFADYETFEEIPLFSRWKHISFLESLSFHEKNKVLIKACIDLITYCYSLSDRYLNSENAKDYLICLSLTDWDDCEEINCLTPNIFVSRRKEWLLSHLNHRETQSAEENLTREYLFSLGVSDCDVLISGGFEENKRVYVMNKAMY